ncbi:MAG: 6,7-dimethyl-8-ribityllumazine synthase [Bacteroidetes bacterium]|nr:6,7-dimethyl-8-ribityllumazine synthase [Bacteroidota bacterium]
MASASKNLSNYDASNIPDASEMQFGIVISDYYPNITHALYDGCYETLLAHGAKPENIYTLQVPGAFELPAGARILAGKHNPDAVICLGCVIKGETQHDEYINQAVANGLMNLSIASGRAFIFGVLTPNNEEQAAERAGGSHGNKGIEAAVAAIRMAELKRAGKEGKKPIGFQ